MNSSGVLVGSWLFSIQHFPCSVSYRCMLGVGVEVWTMNILYWFSDGQLILALLGSNLHTDSKHASKAYRTWKALYAKQPTPGRISA